jgi:hypothetical protein
MVQSLPITAASWRCLSANSARSISGTSNRPNNGPERPQLSPIPWLDTQTSRRTLASAMAVTMCVAAGYSTADALELWAQRADHGVVPGHRRTHGGRVERVTAHDPQPVMADG